MAVVTVVMSVHRDRGGLVDSIQSVLNQSFSDFDFIIVDDCSPDDTFSTLSYYARLDKRIRVIKNDKNLGLTKSLYKAVLNSKSEYIARIDEGDLWSKGKLYLQVKYLKENPECLIVGTQYFNFFHDGSVKSGGELPNDSKDIKRWLIGGKTPMLHSSILFRNKTLNYNIKASTSQDFEIYLRFFFLGEMANLPNKLVYFQRSASGISSSKGHIQFFNHIVMHKQFISALNSRNCKEFVEKGADIRLDDIFLYRYRARYMAHVMSKLSQNGFFSKTLKYIITPDLLFYYIYKRYCQIFLSKGV